MLYVFIIYGINLIILLSIIQKSQLNKSITTIYFIYLLFFCVVIDAVMILGEYMEDEPWLKLLRNNLRY